MYIFFVAHTKKGLILKQVQNHKDCIIGDTKVNLLSIKKRIVRILRKDGYPEFHKKLNRQENSP